MKQAIFYLIVILFLFGCSQGSEKPTPFKSKENGVDLIVEDGDTLDLLEEKIRIRIGELEKAKGSDRHFYPVHWVEVPKHEGRGGKGKGGYYGEHDEGLINFVFVDPNTGNRSKLLDHKAKIRSYDYEKAEAEAGEEDDGNTAWRKNKPGFIYYLIKEPLNLEDGSSVTELRRLYQSNVNGEELQLLSPPELDVYRWEFTDSSQTRIELRGSGDTDHDGIYNETADQKYLWLIDLEPEIKRVEVFDDHLLREIKEAYSE